MLDCRYDSCTVVTSWLIRYASSFRREVLGHTNYFSTESICHLLALGLVSLSLALGFEVPLLHRGLYCECHEHVFVVVRGNSCSPVGVKAPKCTYRWTTEALSHRASLL